MVAINRRDFLTLAVSFMPARRLFAATVTIDEFMELSERLLGRRGLDRAIGQVYLAAIVADPDNAVTLAYLIQSNGNPTPEQRALSATIIAWWNTGIYLLDGKPRVANHRGALSWAAVGASAPFFYGW